MEEPDLCPGWRERMAVVKADSLAMTVDNSPHFEIRYGANAIAKRLLQW